MDLKKEGQVQAIFRGQFLSIDCEKLEPSRVAVVL